MWINTFWFTVNSVPFFCCKFWIFIFSTTAWKMSKYGVISGPYFPVFRLNTEICFVNLRIQSEYRKIRTRNNSVFGHFSRCVLFNKLTIFCVSIFIRCLENFVEPQKLFLLTFQLWKSSLLHCFVFQFFQ